MTSASSESVAVSAALVVFGATGDLAHRKLYPALGRWRTAGNCPVDWSSWVSRAP